MHKALAYHTCRTYLLITNRSHDSNCDAATNMSSDLAVLYFEAGVMKQNASATVAAVKLRGTFLWFSSPLQKCHVLVCLTDWVQQQTPTVQLPFMFQGGAGWGASGFETKERRTSSQNLVLWQFLDNFFNIVHISVFTVWLYAEPIQVKSTRTDFAPYKTDFCVI